MTRATVQPGGGGRSVTPGAGRVIDAAEAFINRVLDVNVLAREGGRGLPGRAELFKELSGLLERAEESLAPGSDASKAWDQVKPALKYFADEILTTGEWAARGDWAKESFHGDITGGRPGDHLFWELYDEAVEGSDGASEQATEVFYILIGLGFMGEHAGNATELEIRLRRAGDRIGGRCIGRGGGWLTREAATPDTRTVEVDTGRWVVLSLLGMGMLLVLVWVLLGFFLGREMDVVKQVIRQACSTGAGVVGGGNLWGVVWKPVVVFALAVAACAGGYWGASRWRRIRLNRAFVGALKGWKGLGGTGQDASDIAERFGKGLDELQSYGISAYDYPWLLLVGDPGIGKTNAIGKSGVSMPEHLNPGIGGTIDFDWWFTNKALILDTAGRIFSGEDSWKSEGGEWADLLHLLREHRRRRPINGVILALPATPPLPPKGPNAKPLEDPHPGLINSTDRDIQTRTARYLTRFEQVHQQTGVHYPVWVVVTLCDLLHGFREFFLPLNSPPRLQQVFGWSVPGKPGEAYSPEAVRKGLGDLRSRMREFRLFLLGTPTHLGYRRRVNMFDRAFAFPTEFDRVLDKLQEYLDRMFTPGSGKLRPAFRGVYFTSAHEEGEPLRRGGVRDAARQPNAPRNTKDRSLFLRVPLEEKIFPEQGLVSTHPDLIARRLRLIVAAGVAAMVGVAALAGAGWYLAREFSTYKQSLALDDWKSLREIGADVVFESAPGPAQGEAWTLRDNKGFVAAADRVQDSLGKLGADEGGRGGTVRVVTEWLFPKLEELRREINEQRSEGLKCLTRERFMRSLADRAARYADTALSQTGDERQLRADAVRVQPIVLALADLVQASGSDALPTKLKGDAAKWKALAGLVGPAELSDQLCRLIDAMGAGTIEVESPGPKLKDVLKRAGSLLNPQKTVSDARKLIVKAEQTRSALSDALGSASKADPAVADTIGASLQAFEQSFHMLDEKGAFTLSGKGDATARGVWNDVQKREGTSVLFAQAAFVDKLRMGLSTLEGGAPPTEDDSCVRKLQDEVGKDAMAPLTAEQADTWRKKAGSVQTFIRSLAEAAKVVQSDGRHEVLWRLHNGADALVRVNKVIAAGVDSLVESTLRNDACRRVLALALPGSVGAALPDSPISWDELHKADGCLASLISESQRLSVSGGSGAAASPVAEKLKALADQAAKDVRNDRRMMIAGVEHASDAEVVINQAKKLAARAGTFTKLEACGWVGWTDEEAQSLKSGSNDDESFLRSVLSAQHDSARRPLTLIVRIAEILAKSESGNPGERSRSILADAARAAAVGRLKPLLAPATERIRDAETWIRDEVAGKFPFDRHSGLSSDSRALARWNDDEIAEILALAGLLSPAWPEGVATEASALGKSVTGFKQSLGDVTPSAFFEFVRLIRDSKYDVSAALLRPPKGLLRQAVGESPNSRGCFELTDLKSDTKRFDRKWLDDKDKTAIVSICCRPGRRAAAIDATCRELKPGADNPAGVAIGDFAAQDSPELRFDVVVQEMKRGKPAGMLQRFPLPSGAETPANDWGMLRWLMRAERSADGGTASMKLPLVPGCDDAVEVMIVAKDAPLPPSLGQWPIVRNRTLMGGGR